MRRMKSINALRFIFIFIILIHHFDSFNPYYKVMPADLIQGLLLEGFLGVDFFFILSGFVCSVGYKEKIETNRIGFEGFMIKRIAKLYPIYILSIFAGIILYEMTFEAVVGNIVPFLFLLQSFVPLDIYAYNFNGVAWCLSDLMFFYIVFYFLTKRKNRDRKMLFILFGLMITGIFILIYLLQQRPIGSNTWVLYVNPVVRFSDFLLGMILYEIYLFTRDRVSAGFASILEITGIFLLIVFVTLVLKYNINIMYRWTVYYMLPISVIILGFSYDRGALSKFLGNRIFLYLGDISIFIYLIHQLVLNGLAKKMAGNIYDFRSVLPIGLIGILITMVLSVSLHYLFEKANMQFRKQKKIR